jgi:formate/nitrite transporter FocA (FNT family)
MFDGSQFSNPVSWGTIVEWIGAFIGNTIGSWLFVATAYWFA